MNNVLLGAVDVAISPDAAQNTYTIDQPNPDGSYNISLPPNAQSGGEIVLKETDAPTGDPGKDEPGKDEPGADKMNKMLPLLILAGLAAFWLMKKRKN